MARGDVRAAGRRSKIDPVRIASRVARVRAQPGVAEQPVPYVQPLNAGFFLLERMRAVKEGKRHGAVRAAARGK